MKIEVVSRVKSSTESAPVGSERFHFLPIALMITSLMILESRSTESQAEVNKQTNHNASSQALRVRPLCLRLRQSCFQDQKRRTHERNRKLCIRRRRFDFKKTITLCAYDDFDSGLSSENQSQLNSYLWT